MKKRILSILLTLCLMLTLLPNTAPAVTQYKLHVGDTLVYDSLSDESSWEAGTTYYWQAAESGDYSYAQTGSESNYLFAVLFDNINDVFRLTLNGVDIPGMELEAGEDSTYGIFCNTYLQIVLNKGTENSINISGENVAYGVFTPETLSVEGKGNLSIAGADVNLHTGLCGVSGVTISGGVTTISDVGYGITANNGPFALSGGQVSVSALEYAVLSNDSGMTFSGGRLTAIGGSRGIDTLGSITNNMTSYFYRTNTDVSAPETAHSFYPDTEFVNSDTFKYVEINYCPEVYVSGDNATPSLIRVSDAAESYWLNDGSGSLTASDASTDNYNVKYDGITQTLTLKNAEITEYYGSLHGEKYGIYAEGDLNLVLDGINSIGAAGDLPHLGIYCAEALSISALADGSLNLVAREDGISAEGAVTIDSGTLSITSDEVGIFSEEGFSMTEGVLTVRGNDQAIKFNFSSPSLTLPAAYKYKSNTEASEPDGEYTYGTYPYSTGDKYLEIATTYDITKETDENGSFTVAVNGMETENAAPGDTITLEAAPNRGYELSSWTVYKTGDPDTTVSVNENSFTMPSYATTVEAVFTTVRKSGNHTPSKTITVTETSNGLFNDAEGAIRAEANMTNAFSSSVEVKVTDTEEKSANFGLGADKIVYPFDISLYIKGTNTKTQPKSGYTVTISLPVPDALLEMKDQLSVVHKSDEGRITALFSRLTQISEVWYLVFEATEFSPYALVVNNVVSYDQSTGVPYYLGDNGNKVFIGFAANGKYIAPSGAAVAVTPNSKDFADISGHWAASCIGFVTEREIFFGTGNNTFSPNTGMTRAMFATVIGRLFECSFGALKVSNVNVFNDCDYGDYYGRYVDWAAEEGIISGYGNSAFGPDDPITREQMAAILCRFADYLGILPDNMDTALNYTDADTISAWAQGAALYCQTTGIITGRDGGQFAPIETATRAEVAAILERFVKSVIKES